MFFNEKKKKKVKTDETTTIMQASKQIIYLKQKSTGKKTKSKVRQANAVGLSNR